MTTFHMRQTSANVGSLVGTEKSTTMPLGTSNLSGASALDLSQTAGTASPNQTRGVNLATTAVEQSVYWGKWISEVIQVSVTAQTWTYNLAGFEAAAANNMFFRISIYVLTSADAVRGFVYDATADLGSEITASTIPPVMGGHTGTVSGSAVAGVAAGSDRIACEVWCHGTPSMAPSAGNAITFGWDGATTITNGGTSNTSKSLISTPQDLTTVVARQPRSPGIDSGNMHFARAHELARVAGRRWKRRSGLFVPDGVAWT